MHMCSFIYACVRMIRHCGSCINVDKFHNLFYYKFYWKENGVIFPIVKPNQTDMISI